MANIVQRFRSGWNAFLGRDPTNVLHSQPGVEYYGYSSRPDRRRFTGGNQRSIVASIYNRIALDVASINFKHASLDDNGGYADVINSG